MKNGFVPALGTPLDRDGNLMENSYRKQIEMLLEAGSSGVLAMGSMGQQPYIKTPETPKIARAAVQQVKGRVPVFVGAMDNSINRAKERMAAMEDLDIAGFVFTTPYYYTCVQCASYQLLQGRRGGYRSQHFFVRPAGSHPDQNNV